MQPTSSSERQSFSEYEYSLELLLLFETELLPVDDAFVDDELFVLFDVPLVLCNRFRILFSMKNHRQVKK